MRDVEIHGVEAAGEGVETPRHAATISKGSPGVLHGARSYLLQDGDGQILEAHSISAGLDYPGVGPEHSWLKDSGRVKYFSATDERGAGSLHAAAPGWKASFRRWNRRMRSPMSCASRRKWTRTKIIVVACRAAATRTCSPPPQHWVKRYEPHRRALRRIAARQIAPPSCRSSLRAIPTSKRRCAILEKLPDVGADLIELGMPFSDPMADGPAVQAS